MSRAGIAKKLTESGVEGAFWQLKKSQGLKVGQRWKVFGYAFLLFTFTATHIAML